MSMSSWFHIPTPDSIMHGHEGPRTSWVVGGVTGYKIHKAGKHTPLRTLDLALCWKIWTAVLMWWVGIFALGTIACVLMSKGLPSRGLGLTLIIGTNAVVIYLAMGLTYIRLAVQSNFNIRGLLKPLWPLALYTPNVAPIWWYLTPFLPLLWSMIGITVLS